MINLSAEAIGDFTSVAAREKIAQIKIFGEIDSTNSYLMQIPGPVPGKISIAATCNQTAGRGRHGKTWQSPPGSGICLSAAYSFAAQPETLPALTLGVGLGVISALQAIGAKGVEIKWPNDLVANDGKLGGILTEVQSQSTGAVTVVSGVGINIDVGENFTLDTESDWAKQAVDLSQICEQVPTYDEVAGQLSSHLLQAFVDFEENGVRGIVEHWPQHDWLLGRELVADTGLEMISGRGAGIDNDGALLIDTGKPSLRRMTSGSVVKAGARGRKR